MERNNAMSSNQQERVIDSRLAEVENMRIDDEQSAHGALAHVLTTVNYINQATPQAPATMTGARTATFDDDLLEKLRKWLDRLVQALTQIVAKLEKAASFSISAGTGVSVTVTFGPFGESVEPQSSATAVPGS